MVHCVWSRPSASILVQCATSRNGYGASAIAFGNLTEIKSTTATVAVRFHCTRNGVKCEHVFKTKKEKTLFNKDSNIDTLIKK